jgi:peptidoglycan/LPS O-acetylase OafA/YrhL
MQYLTRSRNSTESVPAVAPRTEVPGLTGLRFIAAFSVAIAHGSEQILKFDDPSLRLTYWIPQITGLGMGLFFVLSGFVIHYNYRIAVTQGGLNGLGGFVWARFSRLYPLYVFIVILDVLLGRKLFEFMAGNTDAFTDVLHALPYYLTFTQSWLYMPFPDSSLIYVAGANSSLTWSISTEWFFYLSYPLVALLVIRARHPLVTIIAALVWCIAWSSVVTALFDHLAPIDAWAIDHYGSLAGLANGNQDSFFRWLMYFSPYLRVGEFILGCIIAQLYIQLQGKSPTDRERFVGYLLLAIGIVTVPILTYLMYAPNGHVAFIRKLNFSFGLAPSVALIIFCAARYDTLFSRILNSRPLVALGDASYSIYLTHFLIFVLSASFLGGALPVTVPNVVFLAIKYLFLLALILLISLGLHAFFEVPARQWLRGLWREAPAQRKRIVAYSVFASPAMAAALVLLATPTDSTASVASGIRVTSATYGANCNARRGNATRTLSKICNGKDECEYIVDVNALGDPAPGCAKNFAVDYQCAPGEKRFTKGLPGEAGLGSRLDLSCMSEVAAGDKAAMPAVGAVSAKAEPAASVMPASAVTPVSTDPPAPPNAKIQTAAVDAQPGGEIHVRSATYGGNCGAPLGNATNDAQMSCDGDRKCTYTVDAVRLGDPAPGCGKAFTVEYECAPGGTPVKADVPGEAGLGGKSVELTCQSGTENESPAAANWTGIRVLSATYGGNCGARIGNATDAIGGACGSKATCDYTVDVNKLGDPAHGCAKSFFVKFQCGGESVARTAAIPGEAGLGKSIHLSCP